MEKVSMTITRALAEIKLLDKRILKAINNCEKMVCILQPGQIPANFSSVGDFLAHTEASLQSVTDLIERRDSIKRAVVMSNALTKVKISDKEMTVAEAIEKKNSIENVKNLVEMFNRSMYAGESRLSTLNTNVKDKCEEQVSNLFPGADDKSVEYTKFREAYLKTNLYELAVSDKVKDTVGNYDKQVEEFETEIDFVLSESNTKTTILV